MGICFGRKTPEGVAIFLFHVFFVSSFKFQVSGFRFRVSGFRFQVLLERNSELKKLATNSRIIVHNKIREFVAIILTLAEPET